MPMKVYFQHRFESVQRAEFFDREVKTVQLAEIIAATDLTGTTLTYEFTEDGRPGDAKSMKRMAIFFEIGWSKAAATATLETCMEGNYV